MKCRRAPNRNGNLVITIPASAGAALLDPLQRAILEGPWLLPGGQGKLLQVNVQKRMTAFRIDRVPCRDPTGRLLVLDEVMNFFFFFNLFILRVIHRLQVNCAPHNHTLQGLPAQIALLIYISGEWSSVLHSQANNITGK